MVASLEIERVLGTDPDRLSRSQNWMSAIACYDDSSRL